MVVIPTIHILPKQAAKIATFVLVNLLIGSIILSKNKILGFLDKVDRKICEITMGVAAETLKLEVTSGQSEKL